jgi:cytoskeleton-associated protein 5
MDTQKPPTAALPPSPPPAKAAPLARKPTAPAKPPVAASAGPSKPAAVKTNGGGGKTLAVSPSEPVKYRFTPEDAAAKAADMIPAEYHTKLADAAWKTRLEAAEEMVKWVGEDGGAEQVDSEVMMRFLGKTPGWGEKNFQVCTSGP